MAGKVKLTSCSPEYSPWTSMIGRCTKEAYSGFRWYGGAGITVCAEWLGYPHGFNRFVDHIGRRPTAGHQIDRIDNEGCYEPGNVRWATTQEQARNRSSNFFIEFDGKNLCCADWAEHLGISRQSLQKRLERWPMKRALAETRRESREAPGHIRQEWIAENLGTTGFINRAHIKAQFGVSIVQASIDLSLFQKQNPGVLTYNKFSRRYEVAGRAHLASSGKDD